MNENKVALAQNSGFSSSINGFTYGYLFWFNLLKPWLVLFINFIIKNKIFIYVVKFYIFFYLLFEYSI